MSLLILPSLTSRWTILGVRRPSFAHVNSQDSEAYGGIWTVNGLLERMLEGLCFDALLPLVHEVGPPYVDTGVANVEALLEASKIEAIDDAELPWLLGLLGVWALGRLRYASRRRAAFGRCSMKSSYRDSPQDYSGLLKDRIRVARCTYTSPPNTDVSLWYGKLRAERISK